MRDLVFLAVMFGFFSLAGLVVAACDRIVGPDPVDRPNDTELVDR